MTTDPAMIIELIGFGVFFWLGCYVLARGSLRTPLILISGAGLLAQALFFAAMLLSTAATDPAYFVSIQRWTWWTTVVPAAAWFHLSCLRGSPTRQRWLPRAAVLVYVFNVLLLLPGSLTDLFIAYSAVRPDHLPLVIAPGPAYPIYIFDLVLTAGGASVNFAQALRRLRGGGAETLPFRRELTLLAIGSLVFLAGALWLAIRYSQGLALPVIPGYALLLLGLAMLGSSIAQYGFLLEGQNIQRDFFYNLTGITLLNLLYAGLLALTASPGITTALMLVGLVSLTHTLFDQGRRLLDRLFFQPAEQLARSEARAYATVLGTAPVVAQIVDVADEAGEPVSMVAGQDLKSFKAAVRRALTALKSPPQLAESPLLNLRLVQQHVGQTGQVDNRLNRVTALRELMIAQIEGLRPVAGTSHYSTGEAWRFYNVLFFPYVRELSRKGALAESRRLAELRRRTGQVSPDGLEQVLAWLADVDEDTYYKWQRRASDMIAAILWEEEQRLLARSQAGP